MTYEVLGYKYGRATDSAEADVIKTGLDEFSMELMVRLLKSEGYAVVVLEE